MQSPVLPNFPAFPSQAALHLRLSGPEPHTAHSPGDGEAALQEEDRARTAQNQPWPELGLRAATIVLGRAQVLEGGACSGATERGFLERMVRGGRWQLKVQRG